VPKHPSDPHKRRIIKLDEEYREWIQRQRSCVSHQFSEYVNGEGRCAAAHVRRAGIAGVAYKPLFSAVALKQKEHDLQHQKGEAECLLKYLPERRSMEVFYGIPAEGWDRIAAQWFDFRAKDTLEQWLATQDAEVVDIVRAELEK
jgi:hypothetical protein